MNSNISSPMMICKSAYIKSSTHYINTLEYSGNTIDKQILVYTDGSTMEYSGKDKIVLSLAEESMIENIHMMFKDGGSKTLSYSSYKKLINDTKSAIKVNELIGVSDEGQFVLSNHSELEDIDFLNLTDKSYHELKDLDFEKYISYTAERKGVVKSIDGHGLFGINGDIDIEVAKMKALEYEKSRKWVHIISLPEGEDVRTGFDKREMWQALISAEAPRIAKLYNISLENLVMNCAFHGNTENAHVHLQFYSTNSSEGYIKGGTEAMSKASERLKSIFANNIFKDDISSLNATKDVVRSELKSALNTHLKNIKHAPSFNKEISSKFLELADYLNGKPSDSYAYLKASDKSKVDDILKCIVTSDPSMKFLYEQYVNIQKEYIKNYTIDPSKIEKRLENFEIRFFSPKRKEDTDRAYHNTILKAVYDFNRISSSKTMRTVEREISDFSPDDNALSSLLGSEPQPDTLSSFSSEYLEVDLVRTVEREISDFTPSDDALSSENTKQSQVDTSTIENTGHKEYYSKYKEPLIKILTYNITECLCDEKESFSSQLILQKLKSIRDFDKTESAAEIIKYIYNTDLSFKKEVDNHIGHCYTAFKEEFGTEKAQELIEDYKNSFFSSDSDIKNPLHQTVKYLVKVQFERTYQKILKEHRELFEPMGVLIKNSLLNALKPHNSSMKINSLLDELSISISELNRLQQVKEPSETVKEHIAENLKFQAKLRSEILKELDNKLLDKAVDKCTSAFDELFQKYCDPNDALTLSERLKSDIYSGEANISSNYTMQFYAENANSIRQNGINYRNALVVKSVGRIMKLIATSLNTHANYLHQENERKNKLESALRSKKQFKTKKFDRDGFASENEILR